MRNIRNKRRVRKRRTKAYEEIEEEAIDTIEKRKKAIAKKREELMKKNKN